MDITQARTLTDRLSGHPNSENADIIFRLRGVVNRVLLARMPHSIAGIALDEDDRPVVVGVDPQGVVVQVRVTGTTDDDFKVTSELLVLDRPHARHKVDEDVTQARLSGGLAFTREWRYDLGDGRLLRLRTDAESTELDLALEAALAAAAGWPMSSADPVT